MKYFLAIDKGESYYSNKRFIKLSLESIDKKLVKNNNLKALCEFTMQFYNENELKEVLLSKKVLPEAYRNYSLKIVYNRSYIRNIEIPYIIHEDYFILSKLASKIEKNSKESSNFLKLFLTYFKDLDYLPEEYYDLKKAKTDLVTGYKLFDKIRAFLSSMCYNKQTGKFSYKALYNLAMLVSKLEGYYIAKKSEEVSNEQVSQLEQCSNPASNEKETLGYLSLIDRDTLSEEQLFKLEEWESRIANKDVPESYLKSIERNKLSEEQLAKLEEWEDEDKELDDQINLFRM